MREISLSIHHLPCAALITDNKGFIVDVNKKTQELVGYTSTELLGKHISSLESRETESEARNIISKIIKGSSAKSEVEVLSKSNEKLTLELRTSPIEQDKESFVLFEISNITHFKRVKDELNEQRRFQKTLVHNLPGMVYRCKNDKQWTMEYISHHCIELTGYRPEDMTGNLNIAYADIIHPEYREKVWEKWQEALAKKEVFIDEYPIITANGTQKWVWEQGIGIYDLNNSLIALEGIIFDITNQKKANETLRFQAGLLDQIGDLITATDLEGNIIFVNEAETKLIGKSKDELIGQKVNVYGEDRTKGATQNEILKITLEKGEWRGEVVNFDKHNNPVALDCRTWIVYDDNQKPTALCGISTDISERKRTEDALRQSEEKFRMLVENAFDGIYLMRNRHYEYANQRFTEITGFTFEELSNEKFDFNVLLTPKSKQMVEQRYKDRQEGKKISNQYELQIKSKQGVIREVEISTVSLGQQSDVIVLGIMRDISDRKQAQLTIEESEEKLKKQNEEYLALNEELIETNNRIKQINADLILANQKAEENDKLKSAFLANMSHEVRTPMNGILGFSQLMLHKNMSDAERSEYVGIIQNCGNQLLAIINDLIDISKIEANQISIVPSEVNVNELLNEQLLLFKPKSQQQDLFISSSLGLSNAQSIISADGTRLRQILSNLIGNALKFTKKGYIKFGCRLKGDMLEFFVEDTGVGIPADKKQVIFERFRQVETDLSRQAGGTGLGLAISKALVEKMSGDLWVESEPNLGSKFYFTIPYIKHQSKLDNQIDKHPFKVFNRSPKILIAEDNEVNYRYLKELLVELNPTLFWARNGQEAVDLVRQNTNIDLVLMDIKMPVMDGFDATREVKKMRSNLPVIAQTAYAFSSDREKAFEAGCDDYISKPIGKDRFTDIILRHLKT